MYGLLSAFQGDNFSVITNSIKSIFDSFHWTDAVDIIILAILFYFIFSFFRSRKAGTLLVGIFICILLYSIAIFFNLAGVEYILSGIFQIGALAMVIIFQPEIRDLLETIGSGSLKGIRTFGDQAHKKQAKYKAIDNICKAVHVNIPVINKSRYCSQTVTWTWEFNIIIYIQKLFMFLII